MNFEEFYVTNSQGKSNCVIRSFCKLYNKEYDEIYNELSSLAKRINCNSFNDILVFEEFMKKNNTIKINYENDVKIKELNLDNENYIVFCWDKNEYYHMVPIINNTLYDKNNESLDLYIINIYKQNRR
ncbi:MAG: hypothetical protein E7170_04010 [Firmicutes bacterium]|nr:hypothetical protein [Bacillota bacterium]